MSKKYRVVFTGLLNTEEFFISRISALGVSPENACEILKKAPVILKEAESFDYIKRYAMAVTDAGGNVDIISCESLNSIKSKKGEIPGLSSFTQCPQCGYRQPKKEICLRCGFLLTRLIKE
ncbi:MAG: hypothetical protein JXL81_06320 [Deltaproteobacteria bacterium]|nr:hypothetical protein [Deltaproteobacteria bacterium]